MLKWIFWMTLCIVMGWVGSNWVRDNGWPYGIHLQITTTAKVMPRAPVTLPKPAPRPSTQATPKAPKAQETTTTGSYEHPAQTLGRQIANNGLYAVHPTSPIMCYTNCL